MQATVPAGVGPGMAFQVNTPSGPMQVTCPPDARSVFLSAPPPKHLAAPTCKHSSTRSSNRASRVRRPRAWSRPASSFLLATRLGVCTPASQRTRCCESRAARERRLVWRAMGSGTSEVAASPHHRHPLSPPYSLPPCTPIHHTPPHLPAACRHRVCRCRAARVCGGILQDVPRLPEPSVQGDKVRRDWDGRGGVPGQPVGQLHSAGRLQACAVGGAWGVHGNVLRQGVVPDHIPNPVRRVPRIFMLGGVNE